MPDEEEVVVAMCYLSIGYVGCQHEDEVYCKHSEWDAMTQDQKSDYCREYEEDMVSNYVETWWKEIKED